MKKTLLGLSAAALLLSFASCKKDYNCTCEFTANGKDTAVAFAYSDVSRGDAHDACDAQESTFNAAAGSLGWTSLSCEVGD